MAEEIQIFIPDLSYDNLDYQGDLDEVEASKKFQQELEAKLSRKVIEANIGAGADCPAFLLELLEYKEVAAGLLAIFFLGKPIKENCNAWVSIGKKIADIIKGTGGYLNRIAAFLYALVKVQAEIKEDIKSLKLIEYKSVDGRSEYSWEQIESDCVNGFSDKPSDEFISIQVHYFKVVVNEVTIELLVKGDAVEIRGINP